MKIVLSEKNKNRIFIFLMLLLPLVHFAIFWVYLKGSSIFMAFEDSNSGELGFSNFSKFFSEFKRQWTLGDGYLRYAISNTFITAGILMFINMPITIFASYIMFKKFYGHSVFRVIYYLPGIFGTVVLIMMKKYVFDATGPFVLLGKALGIQWNPEILQKGLLGYSGSTRITYFIDMIGVSGSTILLLTGALQKIPKEYFDVSKIEGMGMFREFYHLAFPCCWSTISIMWIMTFATVWSDYSRAFLLTNGSNGTANFAFYIFNSTLYATSGQSSFNYPAAVGLLLSLVVIPITLILRWVSTKVNTDVEF